MRKLKVDGLYQTVEANELFGWSTSTCEPKASGREARLRSQSPRRRLVSNPWRQQMHFDLFDFAGTRVAASRQPRPQGLETLDDWLLKDIGYSRDGRPLDPGGNPVPSPRNDPLRLLAPALLMLLVHH
jgi:hypothetical protein